MKQPPRLATCLLQRFGNAALLGDLLEQFRGGKSSAWYWRQALSVVLAGAWTELKAQFTIVFVAGTFTTVIALMAYTAIQQTYRRSADYPQIDMAHAAKYRLDNGGRVSEVVPTRTVNMTDSLEPYVIVFGADLKPIAASATLNGGIPVPPKGVFDVVSKNTIDHRFTWQPMRGVRSAVVLTHFDGVDGRGFVLVGRSLRVAENKIITMTRVVTIAWAGSLCCLLSYFGLRRQRTVA